MNSDRKLSGGSTSCGDIETDAAASSIQNGSKVRYTKVSTDATTTTTTSKPKKSSTVLDLYTELTETKLMARLLVVSFSVVALAVIFVFGRHAILPCSSSQQHNHQPAAASKTTTSTTTTPTTTTAAAAAVLVTGATGRTGSILYHELKRRGVADVRAFVRNVEKAKDVLGCVVCDESEGIYVGDLTQPNDFERAVSDGLVGTLAIAAGAGGHSSPEIQRAVEFDSVVSSVRALALHSSSHYHDDEEENNKKKKNHLRVVFCSAMGTNTPHPHYGAELGFWKLNAEAYLSTSAISSTVIVKPCGLPEGMVGNNSTLLVGHNGSITEGSPYHTVSREDVASVMAEAILMPHECGKSPNLRFDLCSKPGPATPDLMSLIESSRWEWDKKN